MELESLHWVLTKEQHAFFSWPGQQEVVLLIFFFLFLLLLFHFLLHSQFLFLSLGLFHFHLFHFLFHYLFHFLSLWWNLDCFLSSLLEKHQKSFAFSLSFFFSLSPPFHDEASLFLPLSFSFLLLSVSFVLL